MADSIMKIELIPKENETDEVTRDMPTTSSPETMSTVPAMSGLNLGKFTKLASLGGMSAAALALAKKSWERIIAIEKESRGVNDKLRNYGGANFTENSFGDRVTIYGRQIKGESAAYKK